MKFSQDFWVQIDGLFWSAIAGGVVIKLMFSETLTKRQVAMTTISALFCCVFFAGPIVDFLKLDGERYEYAIVGLLALTGENLMRRVIAFSKSGTFADIKKGMGGK